MTLGASAMTREALAAGGAAGLLSALLIWLGPPGIDFAAHVYQRAVFVQHGFALWNNFWYAGRYSFVTYSLLYYPLAALLGIKVLAVATITTGRLLAGCRPGTGLHSVAWRRATASRSGRGFSRAAPRSGRSSSGRPGATRSAGSGSAPF